MLLYFLSVKENPKGCDNQQKINAYQTVQFAIVKNQDLLKNKELEGLL